MPKVEIPSGLVAPSAAGLIARQPSLGTPSTPTGNFARVPTSGHSIPELAGSDFLVLDEPRPLTVGVLYSRDGDGKTHHVCAYCPQPVVLIGLDGRGERTAKKVMQETGRKIYYVDAKAPGNATQMTHEQAQQSGTEALAFVTRNFDWAVEKGIREWQRGTIVIDTSTELTDMVKLSVRGRVDRPNPKSGEKGDFGKSDAIINRTFKYFCDRARDGRLNLILLSRSKPVYEGREDTGRITFDTDKVFRQAADWIVGLVKVSGGVVGFGGGIQMLGGGVAAPAVGTAPVFELQITNPKCAPGETGMVYRQADWEADTACAGNPFVYAMTRLLPGSKPEDWR